MGDGGRYRRLEPATGGAQRRGGAGDGTALGRGLGNGIGEESAREFRLGELWSTMEAGRREARAGAATRAAELESGAIRAGRAGRAADWSSARAEGREGTGLGRRRGRRPAGEMTVGEKNGEGACG
ncbi:hypothetical protein Zm00014a_023772 [Zea mays]|jgi:hypothetical protein|uniref:Uncharacterized protein n=2 Tax=Zea mays TaxID=4577 RepID=A0A8J8YH06_MAIZE|nr:hypothetical protein ZEAMMB73_Zm00001d046380 [Zea mays]PWZ07270.1 hypothetical protein Zm00014a_023772 [Zea mays]